MKIALKLLLIIMIMTFGSSAAFAATFSMDVDSLVFNAEDKQDLIGAGSSASPDGKTDASFTLVVSGTQAIKEIYLKNETTGRVWSSDPSGTTELLLVKDASGSTINTSGRFPVVPVLIGADFRLFINDAKAAVPKDSTFVVTLKLIDNSEVIGKTSVKSLAETVTTATTLSTQSTADGITSFESNGISEYDFAGTGEKIGSDGRNDYQFALRLNFSNTIVNGIKLSALSGTKKSEWDTIAGNKLPIVIVIDNGNNILNKTDGTVSFAAKNSSALTLLVQDTDSILSASEVKIKVTISLSDGRIFEREAVKGKPAMAAESLSAEYKGIGKYDFVGTSEKLESNLNADRQIDLSLSTSGTVTGIRVKCTKSGRIWDTVPGNKYSLAAVTNEKGDKLNKADGTVSFAVNGTTALSLWIDEEDDSMSGPYQVTLVLSSGKVLETSTAKSAVITKLPVINKIDREIFFTSAKPAIVNLDLLGKNKKKAANGSKDSALNVTITGKGSITAVVLTDNSGRGWDTLAGNNGRWLLGVREGNRFHNAPNGTIRIPVNGTKNYQLLMQDNGALAKKNGRLTLSVTWGDGEISTSSLSW